MDLPLTRLSSADIILRNDTVIIKLPYNKPILTLVPNCKFGNYHVLVANKQGKLILHEIVTDCTYDTLNIYTINSKLGAALQIVGYKLKDIGVVHELDGTIYIGNTPLTKLKDGTFTL